MAAQVFGFGAFFSGIVTMPQWFQLAMGYSAMDAGSASAMHAFSSMLAAPFVARAMNKVDPRILMSGGLLWVAMATMIRTLWNTDLNYTFLAATVFLQGFGISAMFIPIITISLSLVDPAETASAAGIQNFMRTMAIAISTSMVLNIWGNSQFVARQRLVAGLHPEAAQRTLAGLGFNDVQARGYISSLVDRQAMTVALDHTFAVAVLFILFAAALVWMIPHIDTSRAAKADTGGH